MRRVMTIVGTRPELIKMSRVIARLDGLCEHTLVHTGQNHDYTLNKIFFDDLGIREPDHFLAVAGANSISTIANVLTACDELFERNRPEAVLIYGDTNSGLAVLPAKRRKIPVFHMEAGNRCFDQRVPEELNRKVIDHLSDVNMTLTEHARRYLLAEGFPADRLFKVGSHMPEVLAYYRDRIDRSGILSELGLTAEAYFIVSAHREENVDDQSRLRRLLDALNGLADRYDFPVVVSTHPRTRHRLSELDAGMISDKIRFLPAFGFSDYISLQKNAYCTISDSGTITEEASLLDFPAVTIRDAHERPEGMDAGVLVMSSLDLDRIDDAVRCARAGVGGRSSGRVEDYDSPDTSAKVVRIVLSYIDYVNRVVWSR